MVFAPASRRSALIRGLLVLVVFALIVVPYQRCLTFGGVDPANATLISGASSLQISMSDCAEMSLANHRLPSQAPGDHTHCDCVSADAASAPTPSKYLALPAGQSSPAPATTDQSIRLLADADNRQLPVLLDFSDAALFLPFDRHVVMLN